YFFHAEDGIRDFHVTGVQTCALPIYEGKSEPFRFQLPQRLFTKPLARALIEQRRLLALDARQDETVGAALEALLIAPEIFTPDRSEERRVGKGCGPGGRRDRIGST